MDVPRTVTEPEVEVMATTPVFGSVLRVAPFTLTSDCADREMSFSAVMAELPETDREPPEAVMLSNVSLCSVKPLTLMLPPEETTDTGPALSVMLAFEMLTPALPDKITSLAGLRSLETAGLADAKTSPAATR